MGFLGAAGAGASDELQQILAQKFAESLRQQQLAQQQQEAQQLDQYRQAQLGMEQQRLTGEQDDRAYTRTRQQQQDAAKAADASALDTLEQSLPASVRPMVSLRRRGVNVTQHDLETPEQHQAHLDAEAGAEDTRKRGIIDLQHRNTMSEIGARTAGDLKVQAARDSAKAQPVEAPPSAASIDRAQRTREAVQNLKGQVSNWTAGAGSMLANIPATSARNFAAQLDTLKANIAFNELAQMRAESKTGGALGQVSDREEKLLSSTLGALDTGQSPDQLAKQLDQIDQSIARWQAAHGVSGGLANPQPGAVEYDYVNGKLVPRGAK